MVPTPRIRSLNDRPIAADGAYVLYWMTAFRRAHSNFALERATEHARELGRPLVVLEALRAGYPWASDRLHAFVIAGMADQEAAFAGTRVTYLPYLEPEPGVGSGLLEALARRAAIVVTDDYPCFFLPRMAAAAAGRLGVRLEAVDGNGLLAMRAAPKEFSTAHSFRAWMQRELRGVLPDRPARLDLDDLPARLSAETLAGLVTRWPMAGDDALANPAVTAARLPIDHDVPPAASPRSSRTASRATRTIRSNRKPRVPAASRRTSTSGTSRAIRSSTR